MPGSRLRKRVLSGILRLGHFAPCGFFFLWREEYTTSCNLALSDYGQRFAHFFALLHTLNPSITLFSPPFLSPACDAYNSFPEESIPLR
jgi:hypothetical protein